MTETETETETPVDRRPRPHPIATTKPFWDGLTDHKVCLQHCSDCAAWIYYPRRRCSSCLSDALVWEEVSGRGHIYSWTVARQATHPAFGADVPQLLAVVELEEGVRLTTTLVDTTAEQVSIGQPVEPVFDRGSDGLTLLRYRLAG